MPDEISPLWIAACAHRLQQHWRRVDPSELEIVATEIWARPELRSLAPDDAAAEWLKPVEDGVWPALRDARDMKSAASKLQA